jgi:hypothetical protein
MSLRIPRYRFTAHNASGEETGIIRFIVSAEDADEFPEFQTDDGRVVIPLDDDQMFFEIEGVRYKKGGPHAVFDES